MLCRPLVRSNTVETQTPTVAEHPTQLEVHRAESRTRQQAMACPGSSTAQHPASAAPQVTLVA